MEIYFSDFFDVSPEEIDDYGAFNISLIRDLPLFIDPFLLFNSDKPEYRQLHDDIIRYVRFLRDRSVGLALDDGLLKAWYQFAEVKQSWLGYTVDGNHGSGLGIKFARSLRRNLHTVFSNFGNENVANGNHLEKLCLISSGVGRDNVSDFTTNLIKDFLLEYTQAFAVAHVPSCYRAKRAVERVRFNYQTETWESDTYDLPINPIDGDYVLLSPKDLLTKDEIWISRAGLNENFEMIVASVPNIQLRSQMNNYFRRQLGEKPNTKDRNEAIHRVVREFPAVLDYYIRDRENRGNEAVSISSERVSHSRALFVRQVSDLVQRHLIGTGFYESGFSTYEDARSRLLYLKQVIEKNDGYRYFYVNGQQVTRESDLQIMFHLTCYGSTSDVNREVNNGRGAVDFKFSDGSIDKTLIEFKLASNKKLERNLQNQVAIYKEANDTDKALKAIVYFNESEFERVNKMLERLGLTGNPDIILIDARNDNKPSASTA